MYIEFFTTIVYHHQRRKSIYFLYISFGTFVLLLDNTEHLCYYSIMTTAEITVVSDSDRKLEAARGLLPYTPGESAKQEYLALRACGYSIRESYSKVGVHHRTIERWREDDAKFAYLDGDGLAELRKTLANKVIYIQYLRNYYAVLHKDMVILEKPAEELTKEEHIYLVRMRAHYTPEQLRILEVLASDEASAPRAFADVVKELRDRSVTLTEKLSERSIEVK